MELAFPGNQIFGGDHQFICGSNRSCFHYDFFYGYASFSWRFWQLTCSLMIGAPDMAFPRLNNLSF